MVVGDKIHRIEIIGEADDYIAPSGSRHKRFECRCECGTVFTALKEHIASGRTKSCGCLRKESRGVTHNHTGTRLYRIWANMVNRCTNANNPAFVRYGGRNVNVCEEWMRFEGFMAWAYENGYKDDLTIDRINNDGCYSPDNCRWADHKQQGNNKSNNRFVNFNGETHTLGEWSDIVGIPYKTLHRRIASLNWDVGRAFTEPVRATSKC